MAFACRSRALRSSGRQGVLSTCMSHARLHAAQPFGRTVWNLKGFWNARIDATKTTACGT
jgi:hypothetical protein